MPLEYDCTLYSHQGGPNGWKVTSLAIVNRLTKCLQVAIVLSELGLKYKTINTDFQKGDHKKEAFVKICPSKSVQIVQFTIDTMQMDVFQQ
jgi:glutathione S-transferase